MSRPVIMGVVNVTPNSFSDGGQFADAAAAIVHGQALWRAGADILDIGGEASNPSATAIDADTECARILTVIAELAATTDAIISVDTTKAVVARRAIAAGATMINDISAGAFDAEMFAVIADSAVTYVAGHLRGSSLAQVFAGDGQALPTVADVIAELGARLAHVSTDARARTWGDPGLGFGKGGDVNCNWALLQASGTMASALAAKVLIGASRKRFLRALLGPAPSLADQDAATVGASLAAIAAGAHAVRVHNVALLRPALTVYTHR